MEQEKEGHQPDAPRGRASSDLWVSHRSRGGVGHFGARSDIRGKWRSQLCLSLLGSRQGEVERSARESLDLLGESLGRVQPRTRL